MPVVSKELRELRFALLSLFPEAPMKLVSEAARCGNLEQAKGILAAALSGESVESATSAALETTPAPAAVSAVEPSLVLPASIPAATPSSLLPIHSPSVFSEVEVPAEHTSATEEMADESLDAAKSAESPEWRGLLDDLICKDTEEDDASTADRPRARLTDSIEDAGSKANQTTHRTTEDGWEIRCHVDTTKPCQSLRSPLRGRGPAQEILQNVGTDNTAAFAAVCFEQMLQREQELEGDFCVFYHSYNGAALLYEVQTEIARAAYGLADNFAPLPRIQSGNFSGVSVADLRQSLGAGQDHDPTFRQLAISASPTLFSFGSEAPPLTCFRHGYGCADLSFRGLLTRLLQEACEVSKEKSESLATSLADAACRFGLNGQNYGARNRSNRENPRRLGGHMLQMFVRRSHVEKLVYHSLPFGVPINSTKSVQDWLDGKESNPVDGQVRILFNPEVFTDPNLAQLYHYCGDWEFLGGSPEMEGSRAAFVLELRKILTPFLRNPHGVKSALRTASKTKLTAKEPAPAPAPAPAPTKTPEPVSTTTKEEAKHRKSSGGGGHGKKKGKKRG